eukprot:68262-Prymnesium_polylepis.2
MEPPSHAQALAPKRARDGGLIADAVHALIGRLRFRAEAAAERNLRDRVAIAKAALEQLHHSPLRRAK